jgi:hypothetical protein
MSKLILAVASLMIAASAQAHQPEFTLVDADMTVTTEAQKPIVVSEARFSNRELKVEEK